MIIVIPYFKEFVQNMLLSKLIPCYKFGALPKSCNWLVVSLSKLNFLQRDYGQMVNSMDSWLKDSEFKSHYQVQNEYTNFAPDFSAKTDCRTLKVHVRNELSL